MLARDKKRRVVTAGRCPGVSWPLALPGSIRAWAGDFVTVTKAGRELAALYALAGPKRYRKHVPVATWWLHDPESKKACYLLNSKLSLCSLVGRHGLEPWTKGL